MIKLIIFDLDGVLVDAKELHYKALNEALKNVDKKYIIEREEHLSKYDGRPTKVKLKMLTEEKGLDKKYYEQIWKDKQKATIDIIKEQFIPNYRIIEILKKLKEEGYIIYVASNSIRESVKMMLLKKGFLEYIDYYISNEDVNNPKPHPEMYMRCMIYSGFKPRETLIVEDSHIGRNSAIESGAHLCGVENVEDVTYNKIKSRINESDKSNKKNNIKIKWQAKDMNILIPMAGAGSRFKEAGYTFDKPMIEVNGKPMIQLVVENLNVDGHFIFIVQKEHYEKYNLKAFLNLIAPNCDIIQTEGLTEGAACTTLLAKELINNDKHLLIANSDQYVEWESNEFFYAMTDKDIDGGILTFTTTHPKFSFVKLDVNGFVCEVAEKNPISNTGTIGIYYWNKGSDYVKYAEQMIEKNIRTNNEFYVCPVYNEAIQDSKKIKTFHIKKNWCLGTPEDLQYFLKNNKEIND